jgi:diacylglycerol kinase (ATP)
MIAIIVNPIAGGTRAGTAWKRVALASKVLDSLSERGEVFVSERKGHARDLAHAAVRRGARILIAWGGDGTVNEVASALVGGEASLGIVPAGSGNGLARALGVGRQPERAIAHAIAAVPRAIDAAELGGRLFFSIAGIGLDAHVAHCFDHDARGRRGLATYARITARELFAYQPSTYRITCNDAHAPWSVRPSLLVTFANSPQWGNGACIAPGARVDDGRVDLVVFEERSRLATICGLPRLFMGSVNHLSGVSIRQIEHAVVESDRPMPFHVDGEPVTGGTRLEARVHAGALKVAVR